MVIYSALFGLRSLHVRRTIPPMEFGEEIRTARRRKGLTQVQAAELAGMSKRYYVDVEQGRANVSVAVLLNVVRALEITDLQIAADVAASFRFGVEDRVLAKLERASALLQDVRTALAAARGGRQISPEMLEDLRDLAVHATAPRAGFPFAGEIAAGEVGAGTAAGMPIAELLIPETLFRPVDFSYPALSGGRLLRAEVLGTSMEPVLVPGDVIEIDPSIRTAHPGLLLAVHTHSFGSALGRVPPSGEQLLVRAHGEPVLLGTGTCVIFGAVEKVA